MLKQVQHDTRIYRQVSILEYKLNSFNLFINNMPRNYNYGAFL